VEDKGVNFIPLTEKKRRKQNIYRPGAAEAAKAASI
jgi:hypothetical protein